jgi:Helix-turn-helix domain
LSGTPDPGDMTDRRRPAAPVVATPTGFLRTGNDTAMTHSTPHHFSDHSRAGLCDDDVERLDRALTGITYPTPKWRLLAHADRDHDGRGRTNLRAIDLLWTPPDDDYRDRPHVLAAAARTARGHPRRPASEPVLERAVSTPGRDHDGDCAQGPRASQRLGPRERGLLADTLAALYRHGRSLQQISADTGHSYGYVRHLVLDGGAQLRPRGGSHRPPSVPDPLTGPIETIRP